MASPLMIEIMLNCYVSKAPWMNMLPEIWGSPAAQSARNYLIQADLIDANFEATKKGKAWVKAICAVEPTNILEND